MREQSNWGRIDETGDPSHIPFHHGIAGPRRSD